MRAGNFYYAAENTGRSLKHFARVLELSRVYDAAVFSQYQRMGASVTEVLASGMPAGMPQTAEAARAYLLHLLHEESIPGAVEVWDWMETRSMVDQKALAPFLRLLLEKEEYDLAKKTQLRFASSAGRASPAGELVFNSGFEAAFFGTPLDWSIRKSKAARVRRDSEVFSHGGWALKMQFDGSINLSYDHVAQTIVTRAGPHYFSARVRAADITTDQGVALRIVDAERRARLDVRTRAVVGTTEWTTLEMEFTVPRETQLLRLSVTRRSSRKFDSKIAGTIWLDEVSLVRE